MSIDREAVQWAIDHFRGGYLTLGPHSKRMLGRLTAMLEAAPTPPATIPAGLEAAMHKAIKALFGKVDQGYIMGAFRRACEEVPQEIESGDLVSLRPPRRTGGEIMKETFVADVKKFIELAGCTTDQFNARQTALYIGLQLEEMAEKLEALGWMNINHTGGQFSNLICALHRASEMFKDGSLDDAVVDGNRQSILDADVDLAWVTIGSMLSQGADVHGAMAEVTRANMDKFTGGVVTKDENGKIKKPDGWRGPDLSPFVNEGGK